MTEEDGFPIDPSHYELEKSNGKWICCKEIVKAKLSTVVITITGEMILKKVKFWDPWPQGIPEHFTTIFKYIRPKDHKK